MIMNDELEMIWNEAVLNNFKVLSKNLPDDNHEKFQSE
jgi:hypothetical protein